MAARVRLSEIRDALRREGVDAWLFYYFLKNDPVAESLLSVGRDAFLTRRCYCLVPARGTPLKLVHRIEPRALAHLPGRAILYSSWRELRDGLAELLKGWRTVAMQYSPRNEVPYVSRVDAGTVELVRSLGARVVSSGDLIQAVEAALTPAQARQHQKTAADLRAIVLDAFSFVGERLRGGRRVTETDVQRRILAAYRRRGLVTSAPPIVAAGAHSALPHYAPSPGADRRLRRGSWVLLDIWAKPRGADAVYADITWCGYAGASVPAAYENIFQIVRAARDAAVKRVEEALERGRILRGWEVDEAARAVIRRGGYGRYFTHRTGHSIGREDHGNGANMDNFETRETRRVLPRTLFSIEPGIYLPGRFGARSEINVYVDEAEGRGRAVVTGGPPQARVVPILGDFSAKER